MHSGWLAERILSHASLPNFQADLCCWPIVDTLDTLFTAALQVSILVLFFFMPDLIQALTYWFLQTANGLFVLRDACVGAANNCGLARKELIATKAWTDSLAKELAVVQAQEIMAAGELRATREESCFLKAKVEEAEKKARVAEAKLLEAMMRLKPTEEKLEDALL